MKITIVTSGSRGDIQPYIALGKGLEKSGHKVKIATHETFRELIESNGLEIVVVAGDPKTLLDSEKGKKMLEVGNLFLSMNIFIGLFKSHLKNFLDTLWDACQGSDALIFSMTTFHTYYVAKKMGIPSIAAYLLPFSPTVDFPSIFSPSQEKYGYLSNKLSHLMVEQSLWQPIRKLTNDWITKELGLEPAPFFGHYEILKKTNFPFIYGFSSSVVNKPKDWSNALSVTGYWFLDKNDDWKPEKKVTDFLEDGKKPVYIGFGSMNNRNPEQVTELIINALNKSSQRGVLLSGWGGLKKSDLPDNILMVDSIPHDWLFPRVSAVVHHCGAGTTSAGLRAGVPSIPVPFFADQIFWAKKMYDMGVGSKPINRKDLTESNLVDALKYVDENSFIKEKSAQIGEKLKREDGVANAVEVINRYLKV